MTRGTGFKLEYEDRLVIFFLAGIALGTAAVNLLGPSVQEEAGYISQLYETASRMGRGQNGDFLKAVLHQRLIETAVLWFVSITVFSEQGFCLAALWAGLSSSAVLSVMVCQMGVFGPFGYLAAVLPHYLFYIPAWLLAASAGARYKNRFSIKSAVLSAALTTVGICCETLLNPILVRSADFFL